MKHAVFLLFSFRRNDITFSYDHMKYTFWRSLFCKT